MQATIRLQTFVPSRSDMKITEVALPEPDCQLVSSLTTYADAPLAFALVWFLPCIGTLPDEVQFMTYFAAARRNCTVHTSCFPAVRRYLGLTTDPALLEEVCIRTVACVPKCSRVYLTRVGVCNP